MQLLCVACAVTSQVEIIMGLLAVMVALASSSEVFDEVLSTHALVSAHDINSRNKIFLILQQQQMIA